ncbi:WD40 repeat domain-containing protein [Effusibacillus consociatus]|uniref:Translation initiation factor beta propellor-like domain-containing protein n=1 Tax=Effusibacillus consociatus TaxID=1117041 RepID=A0ABV9Q1Z4_9BACL
MNVKGVMRWILMLCLMMLIGCGSTNSENSNDTSGNIKKLNLPKGAYEHMRWSPDGEKIVFQFDTRKTLGNTMVYDLTQSRYQVVSIPVERSVNSVGWISNSKLFFTVIESGGLSQSLYSFDLSSSKSVLLKEHIKDLSSVEWDRKGENVVIGRTSQDKNEILKFDQNTLKLSQTETIPGSSLSRWSYDGKKIAGIVGKEIQIFDLEAKQSTQVVDYSPGWADSLSWSPDGRWIAFSGGPSKELSGLYIVDSQGKNKPVKIYDRGIASLDWSPKGDQIAFTTVGSPGINEVYLIRVPEEFR